MAKHITVRAAQPDTRHQEIEPVYLTITGHFPYSTNKADLYATKEGFKEDAERVFIALKALPGGTFDQLLILMLQATASSLIVATDPPLSNAEHYQRKAASDLFAACERIINEVSFWCEGGMEPPWAHQVRQALAKARGESEAQHD
jgi:hypothetical protein